MGRKKTAALSQLDIDAREARKRGMTYGKYMSTKPYDPPVRRRRVPKKDPAATVNKKEEVKKP